MGAEKEMAVVEKNKERKSKTASKTKAMGIAFARKMSATIKKIDKLEKGTLELIQKKLVTERDDTTIAELTVERKSAKDTLDAEEEIQQSQSRREWREECSQDGGRE